jgi:glucosamine--fructose-6-phosphate aminotransferase (isomerizing)
MCGIFGVTGAENPIEVLLAALVNLEYRGYDSAGIAVVDTAAPSLWRLRAAERSGSIEKLAASADAAPTAAGAAVAHTRWATHGAPTEENAHPHLDCRGRVAVVHNGIIENHRELAAELTRAGHVLSSATDTEVVAHLIEAELDTGQDLFSALSACVARLRGDFALAVVSSVDPEAIVCARRTSPLVVGLTPTAGFVSSDIGALVSSTREIYVLADGEVAVVRPGSLQVIDAEGRGVAPARIEVTWDVADATKDGYPDFMIKEIHEQPRAVYETLIGRFAAGGRTDFEELGLSPAELASFERVIYLACGSSYHAAMVAAGATERFARVVASHEVASEFRYREAVIGERTLVVAVSQSGETNDTLHALREARRLGATTIAVTNVVDSVMSRESDGVLYTHAGPEIGVASTKCHLAQLALLEAFSLHLGWAHGVLAEEELRAAGAALAALPGVLESTLTRVEEYRGLAERYAAVRDFYFLGRRSGLPIALEGALKLKELAYVRAEAYPAGEMKHGPISLIEPGAVVVVVATRTALWDKVMANVQEMQARGAAVIAVAEEGDSETAGLVEAVLEVPAVAEFCSPIIDVVPLQCFAYGIARARGNDVDRPRNLAKVVTVE